ncbi:MAG: PT domain-containing protein, partial [Candidatus Ornithomonoglobus sp.]
MNRKFIALAAALAVTVQTFAAFTALAADGVTADAVSDGNDTTVTLSAAADRTVRVYAASYEDSILKALSAGVIAEGESSVTLENVGEGAKIYLWDENQASVCDPVIAVIKTEEPTNAPTEAPTEQATDAPSDPVTDAPTEEASAEPYNAGFAIEGGHASVDVYYTQDYTRADEESVETAYARNSATGEIDTSGSGQINFKVCLDEGFEIVSVDVTPAENFNQIKAQGDNIYRITKITGDIVITIKTKETESETAAPISAFDFNTVTDISGSSTSGDAAARISASEDGTTPSALTLNTADYTAAAGGLSCAAVLAPVTGWGENPYIQIELSAKGYSGISVSVSVGATKKGPATYKLQYSTDGISFTDAGEPYTLAANKILYQAFDKVLLEGADDAETLYIRIVPVGTATVGGEVELGGISGEFAVNDIKIYGTVNENPTENPADEPTAVPTVTPTAAPTAAPTAVPIVTPTVKPTAAPTAVPTVTPTAAPTVKPTATPTAAPTAAPTATPTATPTAAPTAAPPAAPTAVPTVTPTVKPTATPTAAPTAAPT